MTKIIIQTILDGSENVIAQTERQLHNYEETPYDFYKVYEDLVEEHKKKLYSKQN